MSDFDGFDEGYDNNFEGNFEGNFDGGYGPVFEPTYEPTFEPTFEPTYEPTFESGYVPPFEGVYQGGDEASSQLQDYSNGEWTNSIDFTNAANEAWVNGETDISHMYQEMADNAEWNSNAAYQASWDAYNGPINAEGYTAHDASLGYTTQDTSFIEPASSAGASSMISDNDGGSVL